LKSERTEEKQIRRGVIAHALAETEVAFRYVLDGEEVFHLPAGEELRLRIARLFGRPFADELVPAEGKELGLVVSGFVSKIDTARRTREYQYFHVNRRPVQQPLLAQALAAAYRESLPPGRHPAAILSVSIDPEFVDVNIHPTKREVRFSPERTVFASIESAVRRAVRSEPGLPPFWGSGAPRSGPAGAPSAAVPSAAPRAEEGRWTYAPAPRFDGPETPSPPPEGGWLARTDLSRVHQIGDTFLVAAAPEGLLVADQHTVHERILFEEALARIEKRSGESQSLLFPETVEADPSLVETAEEYADLIERSGFLVRPAGPRALLLEGIPPGLRQGDPARLLVDFLEYLADEGRRDESREKRVAASIACHGAVRAGEPLGPELRSALLRRLASCADPLRCPHGRPTFLAIPADEIARRFLRT
jgi:DNA mismatch repair protein MutL